MDVVSSRKLELVFKKSGYQGESLRLRMYVEINRLRKKFAAYGQPVRTDTVRGTGYRLIDKG